MKVLNALKVTNVSGAVHRIILNLFLLAGAVLVVVMAIACFPFTAHYTERVSLLPLNLVQVKEILDGEILLNSACFLEKAKASTVFVALEDDAIVYLTKIAGVSYRHEQTVPKHYCSYRVTSQQIENGIVVREIHRRIFPMLIFNILLPLLVIFLAFLLSICEYEGNN